MPPVVLPCRLVTFPTSFCPYHSAHCPNLQGNFPLFHDFCMNCQGVTFPFVQLLRESGKYRLESFLFCNFYAAATKKDIRRQRMSFWGSILSPRLKRNIPCLIRLSGNKMAAPSVFACHSSQSDIGLFLSEFIL